MIYLAYIHVLNSTNILPQFNLERFSGRIKNQFTRQ